MSLSLLLTQKDQIHCPYCYQKVKHRGGLASHIRQSLACQAKHNNDNPQLPRTSHDPILTPNHHDTPPGTGQHDPDGSDWDQDPGSSLGPGHTSEFEANDTDSGASPATPHLKVIVDTNAGKPPEGCQETLWEKFARQAGEVSQLATGCVACHTCHGCVTDFRPILGNPVEVAHMTSPGTVYISHTKGTYFPLARISSIIPP